MRIRNLETFLKVAQFESFHGAAKSMGATQPAISSRIAALEADLGVSLFSRDQGGTKLTSRGRQLLPYARRLVNINNEMKTRLQHEDNNISTMRVGIADTLAHLWVGPLLKAWRQEFSHIEFEVVVDLSDHLMEQISRHELDMVLMVAHPESSVLINEYLCSHEQVWVASHDYIKDSKLPVNQLNLWELANHSVLSFPRNTQPWAVLDSLFSVMSDQRPMLHTCSSVNHLMNLTDQGLGVSLLPKPLAEQLVENGRVRILKSTDDMVIPNLDFCCGWRLDDERLLPKLLAESARNMINPSLNSVIVSSIEDASA